MALMDTYIMAWCIKMEQITFVAAAYSKTPESMRNKLAVYLEAYN